MIFQATANPKTSAKKATFKKRAPVADPPKSEDVFKKSSFLNDVKEAAPMVAIWAGVAAPLVLCTAIGIGKGLEDGIVAAATQGVLGAAAGGAVSVTASLYLIQNGT